MSAADNPNEELGTDQAHMKEKLKFKDNKKLFIQNALKSILTFIWNNKTKSFIGRDMVSWTFLGIMYFCFYIIIGAFGWALMAVFMGITQNAIKPRYTGGKSPLFSANSVPGMGVRPHIGLGDSEIKLSLKNPSMYTSNLDYVLQDYKERLPNTIDCAGLYNGTLDSPVACKYEIFKYLEELNCSESQSYGYSSGRPCVLLKINNVFDWTPGTVVYPPADKLFSSDCQVQNQSLPYVYITCKEQNDKNLTYINSIEFNSPLGISNCLAGIPFYFYPYSNAPNYLQPLVVVRLNVTYGVTAQLNCLAWSSKIVQDTKYNHGSVKFTISIDS